MTRDIKKSPALTELRAASPSGLPLEAVVTANNLPDWDPERDLGYPGEFPYTRGIYPTMYRGRLWTMRQYAGFGTAVESNQRYRYLLSKGETGLSVAFDLPTQIGMDSDHPLALGEVGKVGVAIDSLEDMETLFDGIPLEKVSTSMTINSTAAILLASTSPSPKNKAPTSQHLAGTVQNDILKEYIARGTYIYPLRPAMRIVTDIFAWCRDDLPNWNTISISGYHIREAGSTAVQEVAFTLADGIAYVEAAIDAGLAVDEFAPQLSFFFNAHNELLKKSPNSAPPAASGPHSCATASAHATRARCCSASTRKPPALPSPPSNPKTISSASRCKPSPPPSAAANPCTPILSTKPSPFPPNNAALLALRTQQIIAHETASPTPPIQSPAPTPSNT